MLKFRSYCKTRQGEQTPVGDLIRDAQRDPGFPWGVKTRSQLRRYLRQHGAIAEALEAAQELWRDFRGDKSAPAE